ncbi:putative dehydrin [Rosa chinensis]|uniref:Putative dehydrin n=1 Tax=Rosa chinensis TaxID=74649 RepID=A0A2P6PT46_ROSCH|nr:dehydrin COR47 [Rosa chinensis]PRQ25074.1 putative dehydrin [Rosa chinensis]
MADQYRKEIKENHAAAKVEEEPATGCGMFDFLKKKENEMPQPEEQKHTLAEKLHHHDGSNSSSSSSDEEGGEKKKKGLKGKIKEKITGKKDEEDAYHAPIPAAKSGVTNGEEKKGFIEKIKEKLPGQHKEAEVSAPPEYHAPHEGEPKEKKGIMEKIKEKLPGGNKNEEEKPKEY